jgi:hypothetical protein
MTPNEIHTDIIVGQGGCKELCFVEVNQNLFLGGQVKRVEETTVVTPPPLLPVVVWLRKPLSR